MVVKSIDMWSCGKIFGVLHAALGLVGGSMFAFVSLIGYLVGARVGGPGGEIGMLLMAGASFVLFPLFYGVMGLIGGIIMAAVYNLAAATIGGLELELAPRDRQQSHPLLD